MKRLLALILCLCFALGGCAQTAEPSPAPAPTDTAQPLPEPSPAPSPEQPAAVSFEKLALSLAALPELPEEPDEAALWEKMDGLSPEEQQALWQEYSDQCSAYYDAVYALRGDGVDQALIPAFSDFTQRTARELTVGETEKNALYSPANLYLALCMLAETTGGESRAQLLGLLGLADIGQTRSAANALWRSLYRNGAADKTLLANSLWLNEQFPCHEETVERLANDYYASTFRAPMGVGTTDDAIRRWINENTNHLLENAANGLKTEESTLMMLISTLYFKGAWVSEFNAVNTREDTFTAADGTEQRIDFMHMNKNGAYFRGEDFTVAVLPFNGASMWFLLSDEGAEPSVEALNRAVTAMSLGVDQKIGEVHWSVPKFDADSELDLIPALEALGVSDVFADGAADFTPLTDLDAFVSAVKHAARVKVDEEGCEAAAFTAITAETSAALIDPLPVIEMNLSRPFAFLITGATGLPLFTGVVNTME